jgi:hypothetical protein
MRRGTWLFLGLLSAAGCASHSGQGIEILTDPAGAVAVAGDQKVKTPGKIYAPSGAAQMDVVIQKDGFETATVTLQRDSYSFGECMGQALGATLVPPPGPGVNIISVAMQMAEQLLLLALDCQFRVGGLRPSPVYLTLRPVPPELRSPRD